MEIRRFKESDTLGMSELFQKTVHTVCKKDYSAEQLNAWAPHHIDINKWTVRFNESFTLVAEDENKIAGFSNLKDDGCIDMLFVGVEWQSQGVALKLMLELESEARKRGLRELYSDVSLTARNFFLRRGFTIANEYIKKIGDIEFSNAIMKKTLD